MASSIVLALDPRLDESLRAETCGEAVPLALRRFQECWGTGFSTHAIKLATNAVLKTYRQRFPSASPVIRISRLCEIIGVRLTGIRPQMRGPWSYLTAGSSSLSRQEGHSGAVRFSRQGAPSIEIPDGVDGYRARVAAAHEIGHILMHKRGDSYDEVTTRLPTSVQEEAVAEYAARLLLVPPRTRDVQNLASYAIRSASEAEVTVHAATCRLGDPDQAGPLLRGAVLWKLNPRSRSSTGLSERLTPAWHLCPGAFVPIGRCKAREGSLISEVAGESLSAGSVRTEDVRIGSFAGRFRVHAFAWGSVSAGTRLVLSVFEALVDTAIQDCMTSDIHVDESRQTGPANSTLF
jgi:uncharacterized protein DUF955